MSRLLKKHCMRGHELVPENILWWGKCRQCRTCRQAFNRGEKLPPRSAFPKRTHCLRGHELTLENVILQGKSRVCRICRITRAITYRREILESKASRIRPCVCEVCGNENKDHHVMSFDHNHATNEFRGWLCRGCNRALGNAGDNPNILNLLARYLEVHGSAPTREYSDPQKLMGTR